MRKADLMEVRNSILTALSLVQERIARMEEELESLAEMAPSPRLQAQLRSFYGSAQADVEAIRRGFPQ